MVHDHEPPDWDGYVQTIKQMGVSLAKGDREKQIKIALDADDEDFADLLRGVVKEHDGRKNPALRALNKRLEAADHYDHDEHGVVSTATFYDWCNKYLGDDGDE